MSEDIQRLRDDVASAIEGVLEGSGFHELQRDERREFWNELLYDQGYKSTEDAIAELKLQAEAASIEKAKSDLRVEEENLKKVRLDEKERREFRGAWGPAVRQAFIATLSVTMFVIGTFWFIDVVALMSNSSIDPSKLIVDKTIIIALITATVAEAAAMALIITKWGFGAKPE